MTTNKNNTQKQPSNHSIFLYIVIAALIIIILLLPPISLFERISGSTNTTQIGPETTTFQTDNGATLSIPSTANNLQAGITAASSVAEQDKLPDTLVPLTEFYQIQHNGDLPSGATLTLPIPISGEAETGLDVYGWNGESWHWLAARQIPTQEAVEVSLDTLQQSIVVGVQAQAVAPAIAAAYTGKDSLPANFDDTLTEINPHIFTVDSNGQITNRLELPPEVENADVAIVPTIRNWNAEDVASVSAVLANRENRERHAGTLAALVKSGGYQGININYRDVDPQLRPEFSAFVAQLRSDLPPDAKLSVQVDLPKHTAANNWDSGAYDWQAIGQQVDTLKVPTLPDPQAYGPGGQMESLLNWGTQQVNRGRLQLVPRTGSSQWIDGTVQDITAKEALVQIGAVAALNSGQPINPGQDVDFTLTGPSASSGIQRDEASGTYWFAYLDEDNRHHTIYLENPAAIANTLKLVQKYKLQGVDIQTQPQQWQALTDALEKTVPATDSEYSVAWRVQGQDGSIIAEESTDLSDPTYRWTAPEKGGAFEVAAIISAGQTNTEVSPGSVAINVLTPTPTPSPTPSPTNTATPSPTPSPTRTPRPTATPSPTPQPVAQAAAPAQPAAPAAPAAPPPPAVPAVNVPFGYGIQADPRGNTPGNIGAVKSLGFNWVKFQMAWKDVESQQGDYSWGMWDALIDGYSNNGIKVLLSIPKAPDWARPFDDDKSVEGPPADQQLYADFVAKVADRYRGRVQAIEVWNEQNLWYEAGGAGRINAATYVDLLQRSYRSIKAINPDMIVLSGALTPAGNVGAFAVDDVEYLQQMYNAGAKGYFDALGAHPSGYNCPALGDWRTVQDPTATAFRGPFENRHHSWCFRGTMESYREIMVANGDENKAIVPTEFGWAVSGNPQVGYEYAADNTPEEQAKWVVEAYQLAKQWGWVGPMFLWNLDYGETAAGTELANFGILNTPAFNALAGMPK